MVMPSVKTIGALPTAHPTTDASRPAAGATILAGDRPRPRPGFAELATLPQPALAGQGTRR
jgi:hypothetical protein